MAIVKFKRIVAEKSKEALDDLDNHYHVLHYVLNNLKVFGDEIKLLSKKNLADLVRLVRYSGVGEANVYGKFVMRNDELVVMKDGEVVYDGEYAINFLKKDVTNAVGGWLEEQAREKGNTALGRIVAKERLKTGRQQGGHNKGKTKGPDGSYDTDRGV